MDSLTRSTHESPLSEVQKDPSPAPAETVRVLLVEDDYDSVRLVNRRLSWSRMADFEVSWAASLPDGLTQLEEGEYDAIVLDLSLPGSEGTATIAGISALARHIPIVVLTGSDNDKLAITAARCGVQDYLVKENQDSRSLVRAILAAIERQRRAT